MLSLFIAEEAIGEENASDKHVGVDHVHVYLGYKLRSLQTQSLLLLYKHITAKPHRESADPKVGHFQEYGPDKDSLIADIHWSTTLYYASTTSYSGYTLTV